MPKRRRWSSESSSAGPTTLRVPVADAEAQLRDRVEKASVILSGPINDSEFLQQQRAQYYTWDEYNTALLKRLFTSEELAQEYSYWGIAVVGAHTSLAEDVREFHKDVASKIRRLESIIERLPLYASEGTIGTTASVPASASRAIFVVHGRNDGLKETVARFLAQLDLDAIILHEQPSAGRTVIEKFEAHSGARFAVVLLTPDDVGRLAAASELQPRARQNVIFEWGFLLQSSAGVTSAAFMQREWNCPLTSTASSTSNWTVTGHGRCCWRVS